jgi:hypothetical protein
LDNGLFETKLFIYLELINKTGFSVAKKDYQHKMAFSDIARNYFVTVCDEHFEILNLNQTPLANFSQWLEESQPQRVDKIHSRFLMQIISFTITPDLKFFLARTKTNEISLIRLCDMTEITRLPLLKHFSSLVSSEKYLSLRIDGRLLSFLIVDQNQNQPMQKAIEYSPS